MYNVEFYKDGQPKTKKPNDVIDIIQKYKSKLIGQAKLAADQDENYALLFANYILSELLEEIERLDAC